MLFKIMSILNLHLASKIHRLVGGGITLLLKKIQIVLCCYFGYKPALCKGIVLFVDFMLLLLFFFYGNLFRTKYVQSLCKLNVEGC